MIKRKILSALPFFFLPPLVFLITNNTLIYPWRILTALGALIWFVIHRKRINFVIFILFFVGATNWFFSPFFFLFYLAIVIVTFIRPPLSGLFFTLSLAALLAFSLGQVDWSYDLFILGTLVCTYPIALWLRSKR